MSFLVNPLVRPLIDFFMKDNIAHNTSNKKLIIELVPFKMHGKNVRAVLPPEVWAKVCQITHDLNKKRCCECGRNHREVKLECHEQWEYFWEVRPGSHKKVPVMKMMGMLSLCHECHMGKHIKFAERNGELERVRTHLMKVYNLSALQFKWKVYKALAKVRIQARYNYQLDLTYLNSPNFMSIHKLIGRGFQSNEIQNCKFKGE